MRQWWRSTAAVVAAVVIAFGLGAAVGAVTIAVVSGLGQEAGDGPEGARPDVRTYGPGGDLDLFELGPGDCARSDIDETDAVAAGDSVDCGERHGLEVYAVLPVPAGAGGAYAEDALAVFADTGCYLAFEPYVGAAYDDSSLDFLAVVPSAGAWRAGRAGVHCVLFHYEGERLTGSARGSEI